MESDAVVTSTNGVTTASDKEIDPVKDENHDNDVTGMMDEQRGEDDLDINMFDPEANGESTGQENVMTTPLPTNGSSRAPGGASAPTDEVSAEPDGVQIMIRTIPPDIGRVKIEEVRFSSG